MSNLSADDQAHLKAAEGWLELGNYGEANAEVEKIMEALRTQPEVLRVRWKIYAMAGRWMMCGTVACTQIRKAPRSPEGWINRSVALHKMKNTRAAFDYLMRRVEEFPRSWEMRFDLARYACQMGELKEAHKWVAAAYDTAEAEDRPKIKTMALTDKEFDPLWTQPRRG